MLLARLFFDLLRAPSFEASTAAYVQKKLDQLSLPPFMGPLQVRCPGSPPPLPALSPAGLASKGSPIACAIFDASTPRYS